MNKEGDGPPRSREEIQKQGVFSKWFQKNKLDDVRGLPKAEAPQINMSALSETTVANIAVPKADIVALPIDADQETYFNTLREHSFSRLPVYRDTLDDPLGLVHIKDVFMTYGTVWDAERFSLEPFVRPLIYVPPVMGVLTLLQRMQNEHVHMALVIDEYGGVDGLVTIEDILEQIVGDITDEHDDSEEATWQLEKPGVYIANARTPIARFQDDTHVQLPHAENADDVDTIGGLIMTFTGRVPVKDEVIRTDDGFEFEIVDADPRRVKRIRIRPPLIHLEADV